MVPSSTKVPSERRSTRDSSVARSPATSSNRLSTPPAPSTARSAWLGAEVRARRSVAEPGVGPACPVNVRANTSSRTMAAPASPAVADARVEIGVQEVDGQVDRHEQHGDEQDGALGQRIVALVDGPQHEAPDPGKGEHLLDDHGAAEEDAQLPPRPRHP